MDKFKNNIIITLCVLVLILILGLISPVLRAKATRLITVMGEAELRVIPNEVVISTAVETSDHNLTLAKKSNDERVRKVIALAEKYKIEAKHIQTSQIHIEPRYRDHYEKREFIGYFVRKNIVVQLKDLTKFEDFLSSILEEGVNYVDGIQFQSSDIKKYKSQVQALAVKAAREKASLLAKELGQKIEKPYLIQEERTDFIPVEAGRYSSLKEAYAGNLADAGESTIAPGEIIVRSASTVSFKLK